MKIYLSGPITGTADYKDRFEEKEKKLIKRGYEIVNPVKENAKLNTQCYEDLMENSLKLLDGCDAILMMRGWQDSCGCNREYGYALGKRKEILYDVV